jgi:hypothetical protein
VTPAFSSSRRTLAFVLCVLFLVAAPALVAAGGGLDRRAVYAAIPVKYGEAAWIEQQVFEKTSDVDIAFLGSSHMLTAIRPRYVKDELARRLGREAEVFTLAWPRGGFDVLATVVGDLLAHRRVRTLVIYDEGYDEVPHLLAPRWITLEPNGDPLHGVPLVPAIGLYGSTVLGLPRHLLSLVRPDRLEDLARTSADFWTDAYQSPNLASELGALRAKLAFAARPGFLPIVPLIPFVANGTATPADVVVYGPETRDQFEFDGPPTGPYQLHFARRVAELCRAHGTKLVVLHTPTLREREATRIIERDFWPGELGADVALLGIAPARLFAGIDPSKVELLFYEVDHVNQNGQDLFTRLITPALLSIHDRAASQP